MTTTTGGKQFYSALQAKAMDAVKDILKSPLYPIQYPAQGDFMWYWQNGNQVFNDSTFDYISALVAPGQVEGTAQLSSAGSFPNAYVQVLNSLVYSLSTAEQGRLAQAQSNASAQAQTLISDYQTAFGTITSDQMKEAKVQTKQDYVISYVLGSLWSGRGADKPLSYTEMSQARNLKKLLPSMPASGDQVVTDVTVYLNLMQDVNALSDNLQNGAWILQSLKNNTQYPSDRNGGMFTVDPNTGEVSKASQVSYGVNASIASISNDLQNTARKISIGMTTSQASGGSVSVSVEGQAGFSVGSWLQFSTTAGASYDMSKVSGTSTEASVSIEYAGYSVVPVAPLAWQQDRNIGFYYADPIAQAVANGSKDVTGFKFATSSPYNMASLASGGNFGLLTNLLISNFPTITITYRNASFSSFKQAWSQTVSGNLTLFGFIKLGSFSEGSFSSKYQQGADDSTFTITFSASPAVVGVPQLMQTAYVIGGAVANPGVTP
ncbi:hypothetical protein [Polyangium aurulentum]|uniref:hypothetical protein n=1 Tax=Polyangium aurulentum TaxID=2567896 RepID=UPI0010AEA607|nr:hypothetical protein [Polyangium aurulentum]UQA55476.1 hypothetical protein E8A73_029530 [Polyangium aurulentum]